MFGKLKSEQKHSLFLWRTKKKCFIGGIPYLVLIAIAISVFLWAIDKEDWASYDKMANLTNSGQVLNGLAKYNIKLTASAHWIRLTQNSPKILPDSFWRSDSDDLQNAYLELVLRTRPKEKKLVLRMESSLWNYWSV